MELTKKKKKSRVLPHRSVRARCWHVRLRMSRGPGLPIEARPGGSKYCTQVVPKKELINVVYRVPRSWHKAKKAFNGSCFLFVFFFGGALQHLQEAFLFLIDFRRLLWFISSRSWRHREKEFDILWKKIMPCIKSNTSREGIKTRWTQRQHDTRAFLEPGYYSV